MLSVGEKAPDFHLSDQSGTVHSLSQYIGQKVLLFFYPKDHTPGCTIEVKGLRDFYQQLTQQQLVILGVNRDSLEKHQSFCTKHQLPFSLLSDIDGSVVQSYGAKGHLMTKRRSYLIDEEGFVLKVFDKVEPRQHAQEVLDFLTGQQSDH